MYRPLETIPDVAIVLDGRFRSLVNPTARLEKIADGFTWVEGPAYFPASRHLVWSDIPNDRMMRFDEISGSVNVFRSPCSFSNGNTIDRQGRLVTCEHGLRRIVRLEHDGSLSLIANRHDGKRFNSPNDVVVKSDGTIWFTDPTYGIDTDYEGHKAESEIGASHVYRVDPENGAVTCVREDFLQPNGLAFSPDETKLYVADTGGTHQEEGPRHIRNFDVDTQNRLSNGKVFATCTEGFFDGFRVDVDGRIWTSARDGVHCIDPDGTLIGKILVPEIVSNVVFGGLRRNRLYICATTAIYAITLSVKGTKTF